MRILPITPNQQRKAPSVLSFQAVNQKYLKEAVRQIEWRKSVTDNLLYQIQTDFCFKILSKQDTIDTLEAILKLNPADKELKRDIDLIKTINL